VERENARLRRENQLLAGELDKARKVIEVQGTTSGAVGRVDRRNGNLNASRRIRTL
jgi:hypothetical protein